MVVLGGWWVVGAGGGCWVLVLVTVLVLVLSACAEWWWWRGWGSGAVSGDPDLLDLDLGRFKAAAGKAGQRWLFLGPRGKSYNFTAPNLAW